MNFAILSFIIGFILQFEALFLLLPWIVGMIYGEYHVALIYLVTAAGLLYTSPSPRDA
mgnify:CR=1 FL=1